MQPAPNRKLDISEGGIFRYRGFQLLLKKKREKEEKPMLGVFHTFYRPRNTTIILDSSPKQEK